MNGKTIAWTILSLTMGSSMVFAQEKEDSTANQFSSHPISDGDVMMKRTLWRRVDLKEKQNNAMFSKNNEITRYLLDAAKAGLIEAYTNDSCTTKLTGEQIHKKMVIPNQTAGLSAEEIAAGFGTPAAGDGFGDTKPKADVAKTEKPATDDGWGAPTKKAAVEDDGWGAPKPKKSTKKGAKAVKEEPPVVSAMPVDTFQMAATMATEEEYFPEQINLMEIKEDWTFDKKRSRLYMDIQTITLMIPSDQNAATGLELPVASFRYKDVERLFRSDPKKYIWYNSHNTAQNKNLADAFDLRLFYGRITKYSNAADKSFIDIYKGDKEALIKSLNYEQELMELEHGLWEY